MSSGHLRGSRSDARRTARHMNELFALYSTGKVQPPVTHRYRLEEAGQALRDVMEQEGIRVLEAVHIS